MSNRSERDAAVDTSIPLSANAVKVLQDRYLWEGECPEDMFHRVASTVANGDSRKEQKYYYLMTKLRFLPNSPTLMNAGRTGGHGMLSACFVVDVQDSMEGIFQALKEQALISKAGGGVGYNFSSLRGAGELVNSTNGKASGPVSFMQMFDLSTDVVQQGGMRRGANMGILNAEHADIDQFISAKTEENKLQNFNLSVMADDRWMEKATKEGTEERNVFSKIVEKAWESGDPGMLFYDNINLDNPTPHLGPINTTNPCGESPLYPNEACNLGSINLISYYNNSYKNPHGKQGTADSALAFIDWKLLAKDVRTSVEFLDDVIDVNEYPLDKIKDKVMQTRKIGLGVMGWADLLLMLKLPYDSSAARKVAHEIMSFIKTTGLQKSQELAANKGAFPAFQPKSSDDIPRRNATITCIAPTGSISLLAGCSSGIEPNFSFKHKRRMQTKDGGEQILEYNHPKLQEVLDIYGVTEMEDLPQKEQELFKSSHDITPIDHVLMQSAFQDSTDLAVSKTVNLPNTATVEDVRFVYEAAWRSNCKGVTVYRDGCRASQVLYDSTLEKKTPANSPRINESGMHPADRPVSLSGSTFKVPTSFGNLYLTVNTHQGVPVEVFATLGKSGKDTQAHTEAIGRLVSLSLRSGVAVDEIIDQLRGIGGSQPIWTEEGDTIMSLPDAIAQTLQKSMNTEGGDAHTSLSIDMCPSCGATLVREEGCIKCPSCGFSKC